AQEGAERVRLIVRDLRTFSRADEERRVPVDVEQILDAAINLTWSEIKHKGMLDKDYAGVPTAWGDESRLGQVFVNLLVNAAQALPERSQEKNHIGVRTSVAADGRIVVEVSDSGAG